MADMHTVCKEMGFTGGEFWTWVDHLNDTKQVLWERPACQGLETHLKDCPNWSARQLGAGVCGERLLMSFFIQSPAHHNRERVSKNLGQ